MEAERHRFGEATTRVEAARAKRRRAIRLEALRRAVHAEPSPEETRARLDDMRANVAALRAAKERLESTLELRRRQAALLRSGIADLMAAVDEEPTDDELAALGLPRAAFVFQAGASPGVGYAQGLGLGQGGPLSPVLPLRSAAQPFVPSPRLPDHAVPEVGSGGGGGGAIGVGGGGGGGGRRGWDHSKDTGRDRGGGGPPRPRARGV